MNNRTLDRLRDCCIGTVLNLQVYRRVYLLNSMIIKAHRVFLGSISLQLYSRLLSSTLEAERQEIDDYNSQNSRSNFAKAALSSYEMLIARFCCIFNFIYITIFGCVSIVGQEAAGGLDVDLF